MAEYKERDAFPEVPDYKINIGDNLDGGPLSASDIYSPKAEPALIDNVLDPSEDIIKEIVVLIDEFGKKTLKKSFTKELRVGNSVGSTDGTNASALRGTGVAKASPAAQAKAVGQHHKAVSGGALKGLLGLADDGEPKESESGMCSKGHSHKDQEDFDLCAKAEATSEPKSLPSDWKMPPPGVSTGKEPPMPDSKGNYSKNKATEVSKGHDYSKPKPLPKDWKMPPPGIPKREKSSEAAVIKSIDKFLRG